MSIDGGDHSDAVRNFEIEIVRQRSRASRFELYRRRDRKQLRGMLTLAGYVVVCFVVGLRFRPQLIMAAGFTLVITAFVGMYEFDRIRKRRHPDGSDGDPSTVDANWIGPFDGEGPSGAVGYLVPFSGRAFFLRALRALAALVLLGAIIGGMGRWNAVVGAYEGFVLWGFGLIAAWMLRSSPMVLARLRVRYDGLALFDQVRNESLAIYIPWSRIESMKYLHVGRGSWLLVVEDTDHHMMCVLYIFGNAALLPALEACGVQARDA